MILRRFTQHIKEQNWFAVGLDVIVVIVGIFLGMQVTEWNDERASLNQTKNILLKQLTDLDEDRKKLESLYDHRVQIHDECSNILSKGIMNISDHELINFIAKVTIERRFKSSLNLDQQRALTNFYSNISDSEIVKLQQDYMDQSEVLAFTENRLNTASEDLELDIWKNGFMTTHVKYFKSDQPLTAEDFSSGKYPPVDRSYDLGSLLGIVSRNEIISLRLAKSYQELIILNSELKNSIENFTLEL